MWVRFLEWSRGGPGENQARYFSQYQVHFDAYPTADKAAVTSDQQN